MRDFSTGHRWLSINTATVRAQWPLDRIVGACAERGIRATAVCPGFVRTPLVEGQIPDQAKAHGVSEDRALEDVILAPHAVKELIEPSEVADVVAFLLGPGGRSFTGSAVTMDQGWTAR